MELRALAKTHEQGTFSTGRWGWSLAVRLTKRYRDSHTVLAGWSSPVARRPHKPKVVRSNRTSATKFSRAM
jgi:hypothetical protein